MKAATSQQLPIIVTYSQLNQILLPYCITYKWGRETIHDLWLTGTPTPDGQKRIIFPDQLMAWLSDVTQYTGLDARTITAQ